MSLLSGFFYRSSFVCFQPLVQKIILIIVRREGKGKR
jgi:hypothetical protein